MPWFASIATIDSLLLTSDRKKFPLVFNFEMDKKSDFQSNLLATLELVTEGY